MIEKMRQLAKEQGSLNGQSASLMPGAGGQPSGQASEQARSATGELGWAENAAGAARRSGSGDGRAAGRGLLSRGTRKLL